MGLQQILMASGGSNPITANYIGITTGSGAQGTVSIGSAFTGRRILVGVFNYRGTAQSLSFTGATLGGQAMSSLGTNMLFDGTYRGIAGYFQILYETGTSADLTITGNGLSSVATWVWAVSNWNGNTAGRAGTDVETSTAARTEDFTATKSGLFIGMGLMRGGGTLAWTGPSGMTMDGTQLTDFGSNNVDGIVGQARLSASGTYTASFSDTLSSTSTGGIHGYVLSA